VNVLHQFNFHLVNKMFSECTCEICTNNHTSDNTPEYQNLNQLNCCQFKCPCFTNLLVYHNIQFQKLELKLRKILFPAEINFFFETKHCISSNRNEIPLPQTTENDTARIVWENDVSSPFTYLIEKRKTCFTVFVENATAVCNIPSLKFFRFALAPATCFNALTVQNRF